MKKEKEIKDFISHISRITSFIADYGNAEENNHRDFDYLCNFIDVLNWVLSDMPADDLLNDYLTLTKSGKIEILEIIQNIEKRTGKKFR
jgi:hypothetical protein